MSVNATHGQTNTAGQWTKNTALQNVFFSRKVFICKLKRQMTHHNGFTAQSFHLIVTDTRSVKDSPSFASFLSDPFSSVLQAASSSTFSRSL